MGRRAKGWLLIGLFGGSLLTLASVTLSHSDGIAGSSGAIAENQRDCGGVERCIVNPAYCGGCHGSFEEMGMQEGSNPSPRDRVNRLTFAVDGDPKAGTSTGKWEYVPNEEFTIEIRLPDARPLGQYNSGAFDLNASAGTLSVLPGDDTVRITGGLYEHKGTKNPDPIYHENGRAVGSFTEDETKWAGEATNTAKGAEVRAWSVRFRAPPVQVPHGLAFVMTAMLPDGNGLDNCTRAMCDPDGDYAPQTDWDWYGFMVPRRIVCERGYFADFSACQKAVSAFILPRAPDLNTSCPPNTGCPTPRSDGGTRGTPAAEAATVLGLVGVAGWTLRRRR